MLIEEYEEEHKNDEKTRNKHVVDVAPSQCDLLSDKALMHLIQTCIKYRSIVEQEEAG